MIRLGDDNYISTRTRSLEKQHFPQKSYFKQCCHPGKSNEPQGIMRRRMILEFIQRVTADSYIFFAFLSQDLAHLYFDELHLHDIQSELITSIRIHP